MTHMFGKPADVKPADVKVKTIQVCPTVGWVNVNADGSVDASCGDVTVTRAATGRYDLTPPPGALTVQLTVVESESARDSIEIHPVDFLGTRVHVSEGDNGTAPNAFRDRPFTAEWLGAETTMVTAVFVDGVENPEVA